MSKRLLTKVGIRQRLVLVILLASLPFGALLAAALTVDRQTALDTARGQVLETARLAAERQADILQRARTLLGTLAVLPDVAASVAAADPATDGAAASCHAILARVATDHPEFNGIAVIRTDGTVVCHSMVLPVARVRAAAVDALLQRAAALGPGGFAMGPPLIGRVTGLLTVPVLMPVAAASDKPVAGFVVVGINLEWFPRLSETLAQQPGHVVDVVAPATGMLFASSPNPADFVGRAFPDSPVFRAMRAEPEGGTIEAPGLDGVARIYGFAPLPDDGGSGAMVAVGLDRAAVMGPANRRLRLGIALGLAALAALFASAWLVCDRACARPLADLVSLARRFGAGDLTARSTFAATEAPELRLLGRTMDVMAKRLSDSHHALARKEAELRLLTENARDIIVQTGLDLRRRYVSPACRSLLGFTPAEMLDMPPQMLIHPDDWPNFAATLDGLVPGGPGASVQCRKRRRDDTYVWVESSIRRLAGDAGYVSTIRDIRHIKRAEETLVEANTQLSRLANVDGLTGLANRRFFDDALGDAIGHAMIEGTSVGLVIMDVDWFKSFNDQHGHPIGDDCLRSIGATLRGMLRRPGDIVARYGGEEIAVVLPGADLAGALTTAERMQHAVRDLEIPHRGSPFGMVTISAGAAAIRPRTARDTAAALLRAADAALYAAKAGGRDCVVPARADASEMRLAGS